MHSIYPRLPFGGISGNISSKLAFSTISLAVFVKISARFFSSPGIISPKNNSLFSLMNWLPIWPKFGSPIKQEQTISPFIPLTHHGSCLPLKRFFKLSLFFPIWIFNYSNLKEDNLVLRICFYAINNLSTHTELFKFDVGLSIFDVFFGNHFHSSTRVLEASIHVTLSLDI